jgi:hypothetical protein
MTNEELQKYWDACLIRTWRQIGSLNQAVQMYKSITGLELHDVELLRVPYIGHPWAVPIRAFVHDRLEKINNWLLEKGPERDVELLQKLATSKYDCAKKAAQRQRDLENVRSQTSRNTKKVAMANLAYSNRNHDTDWGVTKGARSKTRR